MSTQSQNQKLLAHLKSGRTITRWSGLMDMGIANLTARITDLRNQGHNVLMQWVVRDGKRYGKWWMEVKG